MTHQLLITKSCFIFLISVLIVFASKEVSAQATQTVSEVITTYNTYYKSSTTNVNPIKPDNSHELLAFIYNGVRFSTGINDALLTSHGDVFSPQEYQSLPLNSISGTVSSSTKLALGQLYDGVDNGASNPPPVNNLVLYLTDGTNGLDLGTGVANLPAGTLNFNIANINPAAIGDGVPDILITQIADPSAGVDKYQFTDASDVRIGSLVNISFSGIDAVFNWTADFYEANKNPTTLTSNFTKSDRPVRLWAADFSFFGITAANYNTIEKFVVQLNGNSDVAFIAFNTASAFITLPVTLSYFQSAVVKNDIVLKWQTASENNSSYFIIESSSDGQNFHESGRVTAAGSSSSAVDYSFTDFNASEGVHYYRLRQVDKDGKEAYSKIVKEVIGDRKSALNIFPNPSSNKVVVTHEAAAKGDVIKLFSSSGKLLMTKSLEQGSTKTSLEVGNFPKGNYIIQLNHGGKELVSANLVID